MAGFWDRAYQAYRKYTPTMIQNGIDVGVAGAKSLHDQGQALNSAAFNSVTNVVRPWIKAMQYMGQPAQLNPGVYGDAPMTGGPVYLPQQIADNREAMAQVHEGAAQASKDLQKPLDQSQQAVRQFTDSRMFNPSAVPEYSRDLMQFGTDSARDLLMSQLVYGKLYGRFSTDKLATGLHAPDRVVRAIKTVNNAAKVGNKAVGLAQAARVEVPEQLKQGVNVLNTFRNPVMQIGKGNPQRVLRAGQDAVDLGNKAAQGAQTAYNSAAQGVQTAWNWGNKQWNNFQRQPGNPYMPNSVGTSKGSYQNAASAPYNYAGPTGKTSMTPGSTGFTTVPRTNTAVSYGNAPMVASAMNAYTGQNGNPYPNTYGGVK